MPPITRREQLELDELLGDIYRGIEALPDKSHGTVTTTAYNISSKQSGGDNSNKSPIFGRAYVREYELPASAPLVRQQRQELAALRGGADEPDGGGLYSGSGRPHGSSLKRYTPIEYQRSNNQPPQSLASFLTSANSSTTPENRRRVRIVDPQEQSSAKGYASGSDDGAENLYSEQQHSSNRKREKVKYVNTNKLIYHQERDPDDEQLSDSDDNNNRENNNNNNNDDDDDIDGVTRVEYYHTTWLDRQLGRASKRRSSKELNERQVKEKAMIDELKRSLKNGAITLRQSFKGKRNNNSNKHNNSKPSATFDDQILFDSTSNYNNQRVKDSSVLGSGLATIPRNYHHNSTSGKSKNWSTSNTNRQHQTLEWTKGSYYKEPTPSSTTTNYNNNYNSATLSSTTPKQTPETIYTTTKNLNQPMQTRHQEQQTSAAAAPHSYNYLSSNKPEQHQLLQSHYRGSRQQHFHNSLGNANRPLGSVTNETDKMRSPAYNNQNNCGIPNQHYGSVKSPTQQQTTVASTISSLPSATEVVRSALSRSSSQVSLNQLNKTINLLPNSPPPSPMTPTRQLKAASPSLSPSPIRSPICTTNTQYSSKTLGHQPSSHQHQQQQTVLHGTRTVGRPPQSTGGQQQQQHQVNQRQQPVYANPHASLMQHRAEQQMKQPNKNTASIREFNELDSLLRSLSSSSTHITPGYTSKPVQPSFGGYMPSQQQQHQGPRSNVSDIYARVQKQPGPQATNYSQQNQAANFSGNLHHQPAPPTITTTNQPFTVDVTNKKDENCLQRQDMSEFEPPIELLPSMEDYQNIAKLNPVKNHYWYKPNMSRERAISLLKDKPQGTFIVRDSTSFKGAYGLAVKVSKLPKNVLNNANLRSSNSDPSAEFIRHFLIEPTGAGVRLKGYANEPIFDNLPDLIYQHSLTELALPCKLVIPRADIEDPRFNQKQKQFFDEFLASKEQAKHMPYERTSPDGGYRKYPGDVYVHNEHRIIFE